MERSGAGRERPKATLELCFVSIIGLVVLSAFVAALRYDFISARAPLLIMAPLLILIAVQFYHTSAASRKDVWLKDLSRTVRGRNRDFNRVAGFVGWMALLLVLIFLVGHYAGIVAFMFVSLRVLSRETMRMSFMVTAGVTMVIYLLFEHGFNIELYRGLLFRVLSGYSL